MPKSEVIYISVKLANENENEKKKKKSMQQLWDFDTCLSLVDSKLLIWTKDKSVRSPSFGLTG